MPRSDYIRRAKPRVEVLRGWDPNEPTTFSQTIRVKDGVTVLSGQVISQAWDAGDGVYEWELGGAAGRIPYIAIYDDQDESVLESGYLVGLSCAGQFEIETAFWKTGETYGVDKLLTYDGTTGDVKLAVAGTDLLGIVSRNNDKKSLDNINSGVPTGTEVISFNTHWQAVAALPA